MGKRGLFATATWARRCICSPDAHVIVLCHAMVACVLCCAGPCAAKGRAQRAQGGRAVQEGKRRVKKAVKAAKPATVIATDGGAGTAAPATTTTRMPVMQPAGTTPTPTPTPTTPVPTPPTKAVEMVAPHPTSSVSVPVAPATTIAVDNDGFEEVDR